MSIPTLAYILTAYGYMSIHVLRTEEQKEFIFQCAEKGLNDYINARKFNPCELIPL